MASNNNGLDDLVGTFVSGGDLESVAYGDEAQEVPVSNPAPTDVVAEPEADDGMDFLMDSPVHEANPSDSAPEDSDEEDGIVFGDDQSNVDDSIEEIFVTDHRGRRKVKIDWNDKDSLRKEIKRAAGMRKFQAERDEAVKKLESLQATSGEKAEVLESIDEAYQSGGISAVVELIEGEGAWAAELQKARELEEWKRGATESEIQAYEKQEELAQLRRQMEAQREEQEQFRTTIESEKDAAERESLKAQLYPAFDKYRFEGKLGSEKEETKLDKILFREAKAELAEILESGEDLTPRIIDKVFKENYRFLKRSENQRANKKAAATIAKKKTEALENAQTKVMKGYKETGKDKEFKDLLDNGNISGILHKFAKW